MKKKLHILHLEDSLPDSELIQASLDEDGTPCEIVRVDTREDYLHALEGGGFDLILADYSLPGFDGLTALLLATERHSEIPFIFVSGAIGEEFAIEMLKKGATDYVLKGRLERLGPAVRRAFLEAEERTERRMAQEKLQKAHAELEQRVAERTAELSRLNISLREEISERKRAEAALSASERKLRNLYDTTSDGIVMTDMEENVLECNKAYLDMLGYSEDEIKQAAYRDITPAKWHSLEDIVIKSRIFTRGHSDEYEKEYRRKDGATFPVSIKKWLIRNEEGAPVGMWAIVRDITERKKLEDAIKHQAHHDSLTDLPNRMLFIDILTRELAQSRRSQKKLAILFLDLDRFKYINDTLGHDIGDILLKEVAGRLKYSVRESDTVARIGGDEFNILLTDISRVEDIIAIAQKIVDSFNQPFGINGYKLHISTSIGISLYPDDAQKMDALFKNADIAMYHAKEQGGNTYQFYNPSMNIRTIERIRLESWLRQAIDRGELVVYYQPQLTVDTRQMVCAEALVRWKHPELGLLDPLRFIPLAEETGLITAIDEWVLRAACAQLKQWQEAGLPKICVTVNLSAKQFQKLDLVERISQILLETGLDPKHLDLEITESTAMRDMEHTIPNMTRLAEMGVGIAIDDFGTGYSSLNYLKRLPIHKLKIDRSFVQDIATDPDDRTIISAVTAMAQNMKLRVIAEGVETEEQLEYLKSIGCQEMQGYLFSRPLPAEEFRKLLSSDTCLM